MSIEKYTVHRVVATRRSMWHSTQPHALTRDSKLFLPLCFSWKTNFFSVNLAASDDTHAHKRRSYHSAKGVVTYSANHIPDWR